MPVFWLDNEAFARLIKYEIFFLFAIVIRDYTGSLDANSCLDRLMVPVATACRIVYTVYVENSFYVKGSHLFYHREITALISKGFLS